jgi:hypothetical protein
MNGQGFIAAMSMKPAELDPHHASFRVIPDLLTPPTRAHPK